MLPDYLLTNDYLPVDYFAVYFPVSFGVGPITPGEGEPVLASVRLDILSSRRSDVIVSARPDIESYK